MPPDAPFDMPLSPDRAVLRLMGTSDLHMNIRPWDYCADRPQPGIGLACVATLVAEARAERPGALLLDNGDLLQGTPMGDWLAEEAGLPAGRVHPMIAAMNRLGYDAATLGNHDFNYGLDFALRAVRDARFPVVASNLRAAGGAPGPLPEHALLRAEVVDGAGRRRPVRVGVLGVLPPQTLAWDAAHLAGRVEIEDVVAAAAARLPALRAAGAEVVVALCHSGIGPARAAPGMENAAIPLAALPGIDAVICGHTHGVFPGAAFTGHPGADPGTGRLAGTPAAMPGFWGSHLAVVDLLLADGPDGWRVADGRSAARPLQPGTPPAPAILAATEQAHAAAAAYVRRPIGRTELPLQTYFSLLGNDAALQLVADAQRAEAATLLAGAQREDLPLLAAVTPFKAGGRAGPDHYVDIPAGPLALRHAADLYPYPNPLCVVRITGAELRGWLDRAAGAFAVVPPGARDARLCDPDFPSHAYDVMVGARYRIDLSRPPRFDRDGRDRGQSRIRDLAVGTRPVGDADRVLVATNGYRASGSAGIPGAAPGNVVAEAELPARDAVLAHIRRSGTVRPAPEPVWSFVPQPGTTVLFATGPGAARHAGPGQEPAGHDRQGFALYRLRL